MSLLVITGATVRLGGRPILDGADLTVDPGRRIGLVGRNGAGKSTLMRANMRKLPLGRLSTSRIQHGGRSRTTGAAEEDNGVRRTTAGSR
jgi:ATP-binding cassette, subfamily F, member 3